MGSKVSIITPVKADSPDKIQWLNEMVESAKNQTYDNWELILVNDAVKDFQLDEKDKRIKVINLTENVGAAIARNTAAHHATGKLLLPVDADDILTHNAIELLYNKYEEGKFVYGNLQLIVPSGKGWEPSRVTKFREFSCDEALNLSGAIPVTALHSKKNWEKSGGWKSILTEGLEDVEYWISLIRNCVLGIRIEDVVLQYRKHRQSRSEVMRLSDQLGRMRNLIAQIHKDIYQGDIMACPGGCGNKKRAPRVTASGTKTVSPLETMKLESYPDSELVQMRYTGPMQGNFGIVGNATGIPYRIKGRGSEVLVHMSDMQRFNGVGRTGPLFQRVEPKSMFVHKQVEQEKVVVPDNYNPGIPEIANATSNRQKLTLDKLGQPERITKGLEKLDVTIEKIATDMVVGDLRELGIPGIGPATELKILQKAKELYFA